MAKNNNLTDFLTGVADAIRTKKGTSALIDPQDFESEIGALPTDLLKKVVNNDSVSITSQDLAGATQIKDYAFYGNTGLEEIVVPDSVLEIGNHSFQSCTNIEKMDLPFLGQNATTNNYLGYIFGLTNTDSNTASLKYLTIRGGETLDAGAFRGCSGLLEISFPNTITIIPNNAFSGCSSLEEIIIPNGVTSIENSAFSGCSSLSTVTIGNAVASIGNDVFGGCLNLDEFIVNSENQTYSTLDNGNLLVNGTELVAFAPYNAPQTYSIPSSITSIKQGAFSGYANLTSITILFVGDIIKTENDNNQYPFGYIFGTTSYSGGTAVSQTYITSGTSTTSTTYYIPSNLKTVVVNSGNILKGAFQNCSMLTSVTMPSDIISIGDYAFSGCSALTSITIPNSVTSIGVYAFYNCSGLTEVTIPSSVASIGNYAFKGCTGLQYTDGELIYIKTTTNNHFALFGTTSTSTTSATIDSNCKFILNDAFMSRSGLTSISIPNGVTSIGNNAFAYCTNLSSITIPSSVTSIGAAFLYCSSLTSVTIPSGVTDIRTQAFRSCTGLTTANIYATSSTTKASTAADRWFYGCTTSLTVHASSTLDATSSKTAFGNYWNYRTTSAMCTTVYDL